MAYKITMRKIQASHIHSGFNNFFYHLRRINYSGSGGCGDRWKIDISGIDAGGFGPSFEPIPPSDFRGGKVRLQVMMASMA